MDVRIAQDWKGDTRTGIRQALFRGAHRIRQTGIRIAEDFPARQQYLPRIRQMSARLAEGSHHRTRPLPRRRTGQRTLLLGERRSPVSTFAAEHLHRNKCRHRRTDTGQRQPRPLGGTGVLLLNAVLTVRAHEAASHAGKGWEQFTDAVVKAISERKEGIVYLLWGSYAQRKGAIVDPTRNLVLKCPHPSPFSANNGFFRLPALLESQRIPRRARQGAGALVIRSLPCTEPESRLRQTGTEGGTTHKPTDTAAGPPFGKAAPLP